MQAPWPSEYIVLGLLCERPMHGYELAQLVESDAALRVIWRIERSEIYFLLGKLRERGYVGESDAPDAARGGGPKRTVYEPTAEGRSALEQWLRAPELRPRLLRTAFLARVHLALRRDARLAADIIEAQQRHLSRWLAAETEAAPGNRYLRLVLGVREAQVAASIASLEDLRRYALEKSDMTAPQETGGDAAPRDLPRDSGNLL